MTKTLIIGSGLSGLTTAYFLHKKGIDVTLLESRNRYGGRIHTVGSPHEAPIELGATWLGTKHQYLIKLLEELGIETFEQVIGDKAIFEPISTSPPYLASLPPNPEPSLRIKGGTQKIIDTLVSAVGPQNILLNQRVTEVSDKENHIQITTENGAWTAEKVIVTLPPYLMTELIDFSPALPTDLMSIAEETHTWMGDSIKVALRYEEPFWRREDLSGTLISNVGPIPEMYDHANVEDNAYALMGFLNGNYHNVTREERLQLILKQLRKYFGSLADEYTAYSEEVWRNALDTFRPYKQHVLPHQNNGHSIYQKDYYSGKLILSGTETSQVYPGYMDGAVYSGISAANKIIKLTL